VRGGVHGPQPCLRHARTRHARPAQPPENQGRDTRWCGGAHRPCKRNHGSMAGSHTRSSHDDGGLGGMSGPRAPHCHRAAVLRLEGLHSGSSQGDASRSRRVKTGRDQGGGKEKVAARCSRWVGGLVVAGLGEDGRCGVVVHDISVPAPLLPPCVDVLARSLLGSDSPVTVDASVSSARRGRRRAPFFFLSPSPAFHPSPSVSAEEQRIGENPRGWWGDSRGSGPRV
jgi:hypothetical protein